MSLVATLMQPLISKYAPGTLDKNELKFSRYGAWDFFKAQSELTEGVLTPEVKKLIDQSQGNTVKVPVLDAEDVVIGSSRTCTVADSENTSKLVTLTFVTYAFGFTMIPGQFHNNYIGYQADWQRKMNKYLLKFASTLDTASRNTLETNKNIYWPSNIANYYSQTGDALQVSQAQKDDFFNNLDSIEQEMDYYDALNIVGSTSLQPIVRKMRAQGGGNAINTSFQFDAQRWNWSNRITNGNNVQATGYAVPDGYVACRNRNDVDSIAGSEVGNGLKKWGQVFMPVVNLNMGSYYYEDCADKSALHAGTAHLTATKVEGYLFSTDVCFITAYNSDPANRFAPITKFEIANS